MILILDEAERLFPDRTNPAKEPALIETARFFRVLRALAQERNCLTLCVTAYRPNLNRWNQLTPNAGENAMFQQFRECYLGPLERADMEAMVREIGLWKDIQWEPEALSAVYHYTGGHPQLTLFFASDTCQHGALKNITAAEVHQMATQVSSHFHTHRITALFKESVWDVLQEEERNVLLNIVQKKDAAFTPEQSTALGSLDHFGVIRQEDGRFMVGSALFETWLKTYVG